MDLKNYRGGDRMAVKIRLKRIGSNRNAAYRLVVTDSRDARDGRFIEEIGSYNPTTEPETVEIKEEKALEWLQNGAKSSDTVRNLFSQEGIMEKFDELKK